ncbi:hypothetical protein CROQUDRAFT_664015 [Cronartium quercuum f. sp. fusiforme G11]|uniref:CBM20 domain-containing protein n=1 Tax=Cronartium quercuum f. sp. fusiforme G11 TaxID=708437 RepID=A0A9P6T8A7_9BASI|nr:hypothetical protein CROQUDRAFT_664015 [Cronartium quercuum f. sp. fusiforme G11]
MDLRRRKLNSINWGNTLSILPDENSCDEVNAKPVDVILGTFNLNASISQGGQAYLVGNLEELGKWDSQYAITMISSPSSHSSWSAVISLPAMTSFQYKYILKMPGKFNQIPYVFLFFVIF